MKKYILYILLPFLGILLFYLSMIQPLEVPDEQAHYAQIHYFVNEGRMPKILDKYDLSREEILVERIFGTMNEGENKYSFHPEYRVRYVEGFTNPNEEIIKSYNTTENKRTYEGRQSSTYPPLYYYFGSLIYKMTENSDMIMRVMVGRTVSLLFTLFLPLLAYFIGKIIWNKEIYAKTLALVIAFFPMTTYLGVGINSDPLHNLLFAFAIILAVLIIKGGINTRLSLLIGTIIGIDLLTKPQGYILVPVICLAVLLEWKPAKWISYLKLIPLVLIPIFLFAGWQEIPKFIHGNSNLGTTAYIARAVNYGGFDNFQVFLRGYIHTHLAEMPVWYWGVFKWFGVILPRVIWWPAIRLFGLAVLGTMIHLYRDIKNKKLDLISRFILFSYGSNLIYIAAIFWFDWQFYQEYGRSLGLQARYYMPLLITQMFLFIQGLTELGWNKKVKEWIRVGIILFFLTMQLAGLYTQLSSYYDILPLSTLWQQISQYKPFFAKGYWWFLWTPLYFTGIISLTTWAIKGEKVEHNKTKSK